MLCAIWYHLYNLKTVKNAHGGVLLLVKLQAFTKSNTPPWAFSYFLNCKNGTKSRNASHMMCQSMSSNGDLFFFPRLLYLSTQLLY